MKRAIVRRDFTGPETDDILIATLAVVIDLLDLD